MGPSIPWWIERVWAVSGWYCGAERGFVVVRLDAFELHPQALRLYQRPKLRMDQVAYDEELASRVRQALPERALTERKMFGGLCFLLGGNMCCGVSGEQLMLRVGPDAYEGALSRPHAREMDFTGRSLKGFVYIDREGIATEEDLADWVGLAAAFARSLPPK